MTVIGLGVLLATTLLASQATASRVALAQAVVSQTAAPRLAPETGAPVSAVRAEASVVLDGKLDEDAWRAAPPFDAFVQQVPDAGAPASERTEVRVVFDADAVYFGVRAFQSPEHPVVADELLRDAGRIHMRNGSFTVALDTFADHRNGQVFIFTPLGAIADWACTDEGRVWSQDWDTVWDVRRSIEEWGWSAEMRLPFRSLRFPGPGPQRWGVTFRRIVIANNEWSYSTFIPPEWGTSGIGKFSSASELRGLEIGASSHDFEITPYGLGGVSHLLGAGVSYSVSTRLFACGLVQWNNSASELDVNLRLSWMYQPLSYVYLVYSGNRIPFDRSEGQGIRSLVVKVTRPMRF